MGISFDGRQLRPSRYNFAVTSFDGKQIALFNTSSGAVVTLIGDHASELAALLQDPSAYFTGDEFDEDLFAKLWRGRYLITAEFDELEEVRLRYWEARDKTPVVITLTTTMDCNLGCYYCYEERTEAKLESIDIETIVERIGLRVQESSSKSLHVDWYGGEPLLNIDFLESASAAIQAYCVAEGINYVASIISNGSLWPSDVERFVARNKIRQVQISFDGLKLNHDKRRRYRREHVPAGEVEPSSFERASELIDRLVSCVRVDLRFNMDRGNRSDILGFIEFARSRGWFSAKYPAVFQPARLSSYSLASKFMRRQELPLKDFDELRKLARDALHGQAIVEESEIPDGFPHPKTSVCAALAKHSEVIGADRLTYRCGLQVGERQRAISIVSSGQISKDVLSTDLIGQDATWWQSFDPTKLSTCSVCSFLPICWGGCPKKHLEGDLHATAEQGRYWRTNLPRLVALRAGLGMEFMPDEYSEGLQFR